MTRQPIGDPGFRPQIRIGEPTRRRGGARVSIVEAEADSVPGAQWQTLTRTLAESGLAEAGLFEERVFELREHGEQMLISRDLHVREELLVTRTVGARVEQVEGRLRRTEVEIEELAPVEPCERQDERAG